MKILLLSDINSSHTQKWAIGLASKGVVIGLFSFNKTSELWYQNYENITVLFQSKNKIEGVGFREKIGYLKYQSILKEKIKEFQPDVLHAHYATSYGLLGALVGFHPYVISVWGSDVMKFPQQNFLAKAILKFNLKRADRLCATSQTIAEYLKPITKKKATIIPFGVDLNVFKNIPMPKNGIVIACIKSLETIYNIDVAIRAFHLLKQKGKYDHVRLMIVGEGSQEKVLKKIVKDLALEKSIFFAGKVPFNQIPEYINKADIFLNLSEYESFGVSVIEAMACEKVVIVSDTGGLKEVVKNEKYGALVEVGNIEKTEIAIERFLNDESLRISVGKNARRRVESLYNWQENLLQMIKVYKDLLNEKI
jgi:glycosyltransferase involved in cell wall biosynthesis